MKDFIYSNPEFKKGVELADFVIIYFDTLLIVQIKSEQQDPDLISLNKGGKTESEEYTTLLKRFLKRSVIKAAKQMKASYNRLMKSQSDYQIELVNERRGKVVWDKSQIKKIYTIIAIEEDLKLVNYNLVKSYFPIIASFEFDPIIFNLDDLLNLMNFLDTPVDFFRYLEERQKIVNKKIYKYHNERDLFQFYLLSEKQFPKIHDNADHIVIKHHLNPRLRN